jgi:hypothetical protein
MEASMDTLKPESLAGAAPAMELEDLALAVDEPEAAPGQQPSPDVRTLVDELVAAGEWPEPYLLEKIIAAGSKAVAPLIAVVRTYPRGWPAEATLDHAVCLLTVLRTSEAIPELIEVIRRYDEDSGESAAYCLGSFGAIAFEPLLAFCRDPAVAGYPRAHALSAAIGAAGNNPSLRAQLADLVRPKLADAMEQLRKARAEARMDKSDECGDGSPEDDSEFCREDMDDGIDPDEPDSDAERDDGAIGDEAPDDHQFEARSPNLRAELDKRLEGLHRDVLFMVENLASLADPAARDLIKTAFAEEMVETFFVNENDVETLYRNGGAPVRKYPDWLERYRETFLKQHYKPRKITPRLITPPELLDEGEFERAASTSSRTVVEPIRHAGPQPGRNEPCWCGSGKKYKKCHLGTDNRS